MSKDHGQLVGSHDQFLQCGTVHNDVLGTSLKIIMDFHHPGEVYTQCMSDDGGRFVQRMLVYREQDDLSALKEVVDDALAMSMGRLAAAGFVHGMITITGLLCVNQFGLPKDDVVEMIRDRFAFLQILYKVHHIDFTFLGLTVIDAPDQVQSGVLTIAMHARAWQNELTMNNVQHGDMIWGCASDGQTTWEHMPNSGIMLDDPAFVRTQLMWDGYTSRHSDLIAIGGAYNGSYLVSDHVHDLPDETVGRALISPVRHWAIFLKALYDRLDQYHERPLLHGVVLNGDHGITHIGTVGTNMAYHMIMPKPPPIFDLIQKHAQLSWRDMYTRFNCGIGLTLIGSPSLSVTLSEVVEQMGIVIHDLGSCEQRKKRTNRVILHTPFGTYNDY